METVTAEPLVEGETGFSAQLAGMSLVDLLQLLHFGQRTMRISLKGPKSGVLYFERGEITHAECEGQTGPEGLFALLQIDGGQLETGPVDSHPHTISIPFQTLLLDVLRFGDEQGASQEAELDLDAAFASYHAPAELGGRNSLLSLLPSEASVPEVINALRAVVSNENDIVGCVVVDMAEGQVLGQWGEGGALYLPGDRIAVRVIGLLRHVVTNSVTERAAREVHVSAGHGGYFAKAFGDGTNALLLVTRRETSIGLGCALTARAVGLLEGVVRASHEQPGE